MSSSTSPQPSFGWWVLLTSTLSLAFSPGPMIFGTMGLFAPHLSAAFGWKLGQVMLGLTLFNLGGFAASPLTGRLIDRFGARAIIIPSLLLFFAGFAALGYLAGGLPSYYAIVLVWGVLTVGAQSISYAHLLVGWFPLRRGMAIGVAAAGLGLGFMITPLIAQWLLTHMTWQQAMLALGAIVLVGPLLLNLAFARPNPEEVGVKERAGLPGLSLAQARRTPTFWYIAIAILLMASVLAGIVPHIVIIGKDAGLKPAAAAGVAALYGAATLIGRLVVGALVDRFAVAKVGMAFFALAGAGFILLAVAATGAGGPPLLIGAAITIGAGFGAESDLIAIFISRYFGQRAFGGIYGWLLSAFILGSAVGPAALGFGRDAFGGYRGLMLCAAAVAALSVILLSRLDEKKRAPGGADLERAIVAE